MSDFFEDLVIGTTLDLGAYRFTREEIIAFARRFDPHPFHLDDAAAALTHFGRLVASGLAYGRGLDEALCVPSASHHGGASGSRRNAVAARSVTGVSRLQWKRPVYAGDTIHYASTMTAKRPAPTPGWGLIFHHNTGTNQDGERVFEFFGTVFWQRRPVPPG